MNKCSECINRTNHESGKCRTCRLDTPKVDGGGLRYNKGKLPLDMVPESLMEAVAEVLQKGAEKYEKNNWRRGMSWETIYGCLQRHLQKWHDPRKSDIDEETGLNHLKLAACNIAFLLEYMLSCPELDDRYKEGK